MRSIAVVKGLLLLPAAMRAQDSLVAVGTRVRVTTRRESGKTDVLRGTVAAWRGDTLVVRQKNALLTAVPMGTVSRLHVPGGRRPDPLGGAWKGMVVGGAAGLAVFGALCGEEDIDIGAGEGSPDSCTTDDAGIIFVGTAMLAAAGGVAGLLVGTVVGVEDWRPLRVPAGRLSLQPLSGGAIGVGLTLRF